MALVGRVLTVECPCSGTPHEEDRVTFKAVLPFAGGMAGVRAISKVAVQAEASGQEIAGLDLAVELFPVWIEYGIEGWTFTDTDGAALPLADGDATLPFAVKYEIADAADDLFGGEILGPLVAMTRTSSPVGQTAPSTSPKRTSGRRRPLQSAASSPSDSVASAP